MFVKELIDHYQLLPHPEGGWFKETYRSKKTISSSNLSPEFSGDRSFSTAIYFLLEQGNFSAFHRIKSDECWHFYAGESLLIYIINEIGELTTVHLGSDIRNGEVYQFVVPANNWFASIPSAQANFCFVGCTVSPGFDFYDFELAHAEDLISQFPQHKDLIVSLTRQ
jgi:predicted cupin superfamily sugar epimerase